MYGTLIIVVSILTDRRFKDKIVNIVFEVSWRTQTMTRRLEIISDVGLFWRAWLFFSVHISADSCMLNLLYVISKLSCKIDQRELEQKFVHHSCEYTQRCTILVLTIVRPSAIESVAHGRLWISNMLKNQTRPQASGKSHATEATTRATLASHRMNAKKQDRKVF